MNRRKFMAHCSEHGCRVLREGSRHTIVVNPANGSRSAVPRHVEIKSPTARSICNDLEIPVPSEK